MGVTQNELLKYLTKAVPPPEQPDVVAGTHFHGYGLALPDDYRLFLTVYGPGKLTENGYPCSTVYDLVSGADLEKVEGVIQTRRWLHETYPESNLPVYPTVPGLLPWGHFDADVSFFWWVDGPPNTWRVVVDAESNVCRYEYSMLEFLAINFGSLPGEKFYLDDETYAFKETLWGYEPSSKFRR